MNNSKKSILARGCDPIASSYASKAIPPLVGDPEYVFTTTDDEFIEKLSSRKWSVIFFAPGACRYSSANQPIPGNNSQTKGWTLRHYRELVSEHQEDETKIVETQEEKEVVGLLKIALDDAPNTN